MNQWEKDLEKLMAQLPPSKYTNGDFLAMLVPDAIDELERMHKKAMDGRTGLEGEEAFEAMMDERKACASLAGAIRTKYEDFIVELCRLARFKENPKEFDDAKKAVETQLGIKLENTPGWKGVNLARLLSNAFKHKRGKVHQPLVDEFGRPLGEEIQYEDEDWLAIIADTEKALRHLCSLVT